MILKKNKQVVPRKINSANQILLTYCVRNQWNSGLRVGSCPGKLFYILDDAAALDPSQTMCKNLKKIYKSFTSFSCEFDNNHSNLNWYRYVNCKENRKTRLRVVKISTSLTIPIFQSKILPNGLSRDSFFISGQCSFSSMIFITLSSSIIS